MICDPCVKPCEWRCEHQGNCRVMCFLPCTRLPCNKPCSKCKVLRLFHNWFLANLKLALACGHVCPSLCGERCPKTCSQCEGQTSSTTAQISLSCGHRFDISVLDKHAHVDDIYITNSEGDFTSLSLSKGVPDVPLCPTCSTPIKHVRRYSLVQQVKNLHENIDRMVAKMGRKLSLFEHTFCHVERKLKSDFRDFCKRIRPSPTAAKSNQNLVWDRINAFTRPQNQVVAFRGKAAAKLGRQ